MKFTQRPIPMGEKSIGIWLEFFDVAIALSIITNSWILAFYTFSSFDFSNKYLNFVILILIKFIFQYTLTLFFENEEKTINLLKRY